MKNNKKVIQFVLLAVLFASVVAISVGFAFMSTSLQITGTAKVTPATWKVLFTENSFSKTGDASEGKTPVLADTSFTNYEVVLTKPGDSGTYLVTVENQGTIDAKVSSVTLGSTLSFDGTTQADEDIVSSNIVYTITWEDGSAIQQNDELAAGASKNIKITVSYPSTATQLPEHDVSVSGRDLTVVFVQK